MDTDKTISFRSLRLALRFVLPLVTALALLAYAVVPLVDKLTLRWFVRDLDIRSRLVTSTLQEPFENLLLLGDKTKINNILARTIKDERLLALGYCSPEGKLIYHTLNFPESLSCALPLNSAGKAQHLLQLTRGLVHVAVNPLNIDNNLTGSLLLVHDMSFVERRSADTRNYVILLFVILGVVTSLITVFIAHLSWRGWMNGVRAMLRGEGLVKPFSSPANSEVQPLVVDLRGLLRSLDAERRLADDATINWNPESLHRLLHKQLAGERVIIVSNREPYIHINTADGIAVNRPASGLVTAVEPVMQACSGTWIAHGSGNADRESVDRYDRVSAPPGFSNYTLRRIWLSAEEETGYYYGFSNEGLWPLCHNAHVRPIFRSSDWAQYVSVNQRFADAVAKEAVGDDPVVMVQDYHLALLPGMVRKLLPKATIINFWHIPWPNSESFGICPWRTELLQGMLGSNILGFHTPLHCKNFLETVDRYLETRIEHESATIFHGGKLCMVESYPISIQWHPPWQPTQASIEESRQIVRQLLGVEPDHLLGLGVDRLDYTKGILERLRAVENMLERFPKMIGRFTFVQIAAPSRSALDEYQAYEARVRSLAIRINRRFSSGVYQPVCLKLEHHQPEDVNRYYRAADVCMVTSLHDGMNLVAKEFVAARDDEQGVLVLSQFAGAAHELHEALIVNPYHIEQTADTLNYALTMSPYEQQDRMRSMRSMVRDFNTYRWAGRMLIDAARIRQREALAEKFGKTV